MSVRKVVFAVGASGGHIFPALATAQELKRRGVSSVFVLGGKKFADKIEEAGFAVHIIPALPWNGRGLLGKAKSLLALVGAIVRSAKYILKEKPDAICGTGGYASVAPVLAGRLLFKRTCVHEQNVVPGLATKLLSRIVPVVCVTFKRTRAYLPASRKVVVTGSPLRKDVLEFFAQKHERSTDKFHILVTGGSLGAHFLSDAVPAALATLPEELRRKIKVTHQARPEDVETVRGVYGVSRISADVDFFFDDMKEKMAAAHLVIARPGTSTMLEVSLAGRAAIYIPHEMADGHQVANGQAVAEAGAGILLRQGACEGTSLLKERIVSLIENSADLHELEQAAKAFAQTDGAKNFADVILGKV